MLELSKPLADGCVLQSGMPVTIWGRADAGASVDVSMQGRRARGRADADGAWRAVLDPLEPGGPFALRARSSSGDELAVSVYAGEVYVCAGQSNMEMEMASLRVEYPDAFDRGPDPLLRHCKIGVAYDLSGPRSTPVSAAWSGCDAGTVGGFSAVGYCFGRIMRERLGVPVGLLNISLGGSPIEAWMDTATLKAYPDVLASLQPYLGAGVAERLGRASVEARDQWYRKLGYVGAADGGGMLADGGWRLGGAGGDGSPWRTITLPCRFADQELAGFRGELELRRTFHLPCAHAGRSYGEALVRLGTMTDADHTWLNGRLLGGRINQYESRDYTVPAGVLHEGDNELVVRLVVERAGGQVTPGKPMALTVGGMTVDLSGRWRCRVVAAADRDCPAEDFVRWKPTGLYHAMLAPCTRYAARAVLWYQGESNTGMTAGRYGDMLAAMIALWRERWGQSRLPFLIVQLPDAPTGYDEAGWQAVRDGQARVAARVEDTAVVVTLGYGDPTDLHPARKQPIAELLADAAMPLVYGEGGRCAESTEHHDPAGCDAAPAKPEPIDRKDDDDAAGFPVRPMRLCAGRHRRARGAGVA